MTTETKPVEEQQQQAQAQEAKAAPKERVFTQAEFNAAMSKQQKATAEKEKALRDSEARVKATEERLNALSEEIETLKMAGADEDEIAHARMQRQRLREIDERERKVMERERAAELASRQVTVQLLANQYGVPVEVIEDAPTQKDMEIAALRWVIEHPKDAPKARDGKSDDDDMKPSKPLETGEGRNSRVSVPDPLRDPKGFEEYYQRIKAAGRAR